MDYSKILYRLLCEIPQKDGSVKEVPILPQAYSEHRFSDHFIYGYRDSYVDIYDKDSHTSVLSQHTYDEIVEYHQKWLLVRKFALWGAFDFQGVPVRLIEFASQQDLIHSLDFPEN